MKTKMPIQFKIGVTGSKNSGKTSLLKKFSENQFCSSYPSLNTKSKTITINKKPITLNFTDPLESKSISSMDAIIITIDITSQDSFLWAKRYLEKEVHKDLYPKVYLIGTKSDLKSSCLVENEEIEKYASENKLGGSFVTSAKYGNQIKPAFNTIAENCCQKKSEIIRNELLSNKYKTQIANKLQAYINRIETYKKEDGNYNRGLWFFTTSRAINREANYLLAKEILQSLQEGTCIQDLASQISEMRDEVIDINKLHRKDGYVRRDIGSSELNEIIAEVSSIAQLKR